VGGTKLLLLFIDKTLSLGFFVFYGFSDLNDCDSYGIFIDLFIGSFMFDNNGLRLAFVGNFNNVFWSHGF
jgi:hypothetical protein